MRDVYEASLLSLLGKHLYKLGKTWQCINDYLLDVFSFILFVFIC